MPQRKRLSVAFWAWCRSQRPRFGLEAFASMPHCRLHITAGLNNEPDFLKLYHRELFELPNITCHGFMDCQSAEFRSLLEQCFVLSLRLVPKAFPRLAQC